MVWVVKRAFAQKVGSIQKQKDKLVPVKANFLEFVCCINGKISVAFEC